MGKELKHLISNSGIEATLSFTIASSVECSSDWVKSESGTDWIIREQGLVCEVSLQNRGSYCTYILRVTNTGQLPIDIYHLKLGPEKVVWESGLSAPHALYALHPRVTGVSDYDADEVLGLPPLAPLPMNDWHELSERCPELPHLEALVLTDGWDSPAFIEGPLTQNHAHQRKKIRWTGANEIQMDCVHRFIGIESRCLTEGESLSESGFIQFRPDGDLNHALRDYLEALAQSTGTRGDLNPLINERFFCT